MIFSLRSNLVLHIVAYLNILQINAFCISDWRASIAACRVSSRLLPALLPIDSNARVRVRAVHRECPVREVRSR